MRGGALGDELVEVQVERGRRRAHDFTGLELFGGDTGQRVYRMPPDRQIDAVTFTSASTVRNFVSIIGSDQQQTCCARTTVAPSGPVTPRPPSTWAPTPRLYSGEWRYSSARRRARDPLQTQPRSGDGDLQDDTSPTEHGDPGQGT